MNKPSATPVKPNAQRGEFKRVIVKVRADISTDAQLRVWAASVKDSKKCTRGVGAIVDSLVKFAIKNKFTPCK